MGTDELKTLQEQLSLQTKKLDLIMAIDDIRDNTPEPTAMLASIVNLIAKQLEADFCMVALLNQETGEVELKAFNDYRLQFSQLNQDLLYKLAVQAMELDNITIWDGDTLLPDQTLGDGKVQLVVVPIIMGEHKRLGVLLLARSKIPFGANDIALLTVAEDHIDSAVIQGYVYYELQQHVKELETIYRIDHIRDRGLPFDEMLNVVLQELGSTLQAEMGFMMLYDKAGKQLELRASTHDDLFHVAPYYNLVSQVANEALQQGNLLCRNHLNDQLRSIMALPLTFNEQIIGVMGVINRYGLERFKVEDERLLNAIGSQIDTAIFESLEKRHLREVLGRSVDPRIMERLLDNTNKEFLKGERTTLTVLYCDLRGSTRLTEDIDPETLVEFINHYLSQMTETILAHEGTLDKFVGDEVMALFGAPFPLADHPLRAVKVGLEMQKVHKSVLEHWQTQGIDSVPIGVGIATGELIVGEMGSPRRTDYTAIGSAANLGSRICGVAQGGQVLISEATYDLVQTQVDAIPINGLQFKGIAGSTTVYQVIRLLD